MKNLIKVAVALVSMSVMAGANGQQSCNANIVATAPDSEFEVHGDGTATHTPTGLMWSVCLVGQTHMFGGACDGTPFEKTWEDAHFLASSETPGGYSDWRLPNVNELVSILELQCENPAMNTTVFPGVSDAFMLWTSTPATIDGLGHVVMVASGMPGPGDMSAMHPFILVRGN